MQLFNQIHQRFTLLEERIQILESQTATHRKIMLFTASILGGAVLILTLILTWMVWMI